MFSNEIFKIFNYIILYKLQFLGYKGKKKEIFFHGDGIN